jgi:hypothetical protein
MKGTGFMLEDIILVDNLLVPTVIGVCTVHLGEIRGIYIKTIPHKPNSANCDGHDKGTMTSG